MIIEFKVTNFKSIKEEQVFSFVSTAIKEFPHNIKKNETFELGVLKSATMYGANASGKSNLIKAVNFFQKFVVMSFKNSQKGDKIDRIPFMLDEKSRDCPTKLEMSFFLTENQLVTYGFSVNDNEVLKEHLEINEEEYFSRDRDTFDFKKEFVEHWQIRKELINPNSLFLSLLASTNDDLGFKIYDWIQNNIVVFSGLRSLREKKTIELFRDSDELAKEITEMVKIADLGIEELSVVENKIDSDALEELPEEIKKLVLKREDKYKLATNHFIFDEKGEISGEIQVNGVSQFESDGTQQFLGLSGHIVNAIKNGKTLFIDELGAQFHPIMSRYIINMFNSSSNLKGQLFFTTHDVTNLSNEIFRRDQIWFAEKNQQMASEFKSLVEYKFNNSRVRNDERFAKNYMQGKYGAIPFIDYSFEYIKDKWWGDNYE
ncbi:AAA family ATPase [Candidatus Enterococcus mansonii]|uniref:ATPase AAA-type core domain-containing protein n=1 Tax=Candidatus Enterococcus mansonii TaxID=1834181 RepID=A0A242CHP6_9ENTE|nr:ATP-binding protein [Enterococcus sp. 4G2_DIV0659]OTO09757.1 hypothetical protein A5880_000438 [Enterococcus sp. 4G2_DIV0659]